MNISSRLKRFLAAIGGTDSIPDPETKIEILLANIAARLNKQLLPVPTSVNDNGKIMVVRNGRWALDNTFNKVTVSGSVPTITPSVDTIYTCGTLTRLTISNPPAVGSFFIIFFSGAAPTVVTGIDNFTVEANKRYRINVTDGYATFDSWPVSGV